MKATPAEVEKYLRMISETPQRIAQAAKGSEDEQLHFRDESFQAFSLQRDHLVRVLKPLSSESWERSALIFDRRRTVFTQVRRLAKHETEHVEQMEAVLRDKRS